MELLPLSWRICLHGPFAEVPREAHCGPQEQQKEQVWARMFLTDTLEPLRWPKIEENRVAAVAKHRSRLREDFFADTIHHMVGPTAGPEATCGAGTCLDSPPRLYEMTRVWRPSSSGSWNLPMVLFFFLFSYFMLSTHTNIRPATTYHPLHHVLHQAATDHANQALVHPTLARRHHHHQGFI